MVSLLRQSIHITNPYFVPDEKMISTLLDAARRGVKVVLLIPARCSSRISPTRVR
jgi:cardiolipin synthase